MISALASRSAGPVYRIFPIAGSCGHNVSANALVTIAERDDEYPALVKSRPATIGTPDFMATWRTNSMSRPISG